MGMSMNTSGGGGGRRGRRRGLNSEINVTPFVDVMLVLLIVFMITAPLLTTGIDVTLPSAQRLRRIVSCRDRLCMQQNCCIFFSLASAAAV